MSGEILETGVMARIHEKTALGSARIQTLGPLEQVKNALRQLGLYWGIGLFCVLFPLLHFILVPFFLILGIVLSARAGLAKKVVIEGSVSCPECKKPFPIKPALARWPLNEVCEECRWSFTIVPCSSE